MFKKLKVYNEFLFLLLLLFSFSFSWSFTSFAAAQAASGVSYLPKRPKLVLTLVIDQFRPDNFTKFEKYFLPAKNAKGELGGFRYLLEQGAYYPQGQYDILQPMTAPGHATILSGSYPYQGGIPLNNWYDYSLKDMVYCVEDRDVKTVGAENKDIHVGTSPKNFLGTTVGDELKNAGYPSKVVSIGLKDRAAILMGGHRADLALWMDGSELVWVSSQFYLPDGKLPEWVNNLNNKLKERKGRTYIWEAKGEGSGFSLPIRPAKPYPWLGSYAKSIGEDFPHKIIEGTKPALTSPLGITMTVDAAMAAMDQYQMGRDEISDLLAVSFSSHDYVGHAFGPNSRENEEMVLAEDKEMARLLNYVNKKVPGGLKEVVIVFTADHGVSPVAQWLKENHIHAGTIKQNDFVQKIETHLNEKFGKIEGKESEKSHWVKFAEDLNFWFDKEILEKRKIKDSDFYDEVKKALSLNTEIIHTFSLSDNYQNRFPPGVLERRMKKTFFPPRSGQVIGISRPFHYLEGLTASHMAPYSYDETVPIIFVGPRVKAGEYGERAEVIDIASTLSFLLGVVPPTLSEGRVLTEIIKK